MAGVFARTEEEMLGVGAALAAVLRAGDIVALSGGLGAGKTTLARGLLSALDLAEEAPSPTFAIVQPYAPPDVSLPVAHVDLYRLDDAEEVAELGLEEYLADGALLIEWPERLGGRLWPDALLVHIDFHAEGARRLTASLPPSWRDRWPFP
ncbi:tRNA (adenosine(37)-N6)-threonylcarbamoyltransferase complex ATPase subunit type 1 TsaE [Sphingobium sp. DEHP117]|uniref:tRNA (adenosine(37)-N6)-threonylcarbamoyltransferase complex ATPase subunit type 1 TsaE n=1 Tax=Sphingobium sp. DEHP117 TaxID=2993436 RepID=UPI0027D5D210|nr:tRNA (adenosine(37)-N6)-threonylcarbamoyltransferase complex ATPase subunit type 1 TsaE [Sphingobium sp. DEHP117]MDQ4419560.1 tRNA (adenosine(37)-N6)-threonylcarbamoyltransferase complex ATPase subunit type 1 TsaE [Sphingobium sp. DEHP117]